MLTYANTFPTGAKKPTSEELRHRFDGKRDKAWYVGILWAIVAIVYGSMMFDGSLGLNLCFLIFLYISASWPHSFLAINYIRWRHRSAQCENPRWSMNEATFGYMLDHFSLVSPYILTTSWHPPSLLRLLCDVLCDLPTNLGQMWGSVRLWSCACVAVLPKALQKAQLWLSLAPNGENVNSNGCRFKLELSRQLPSRRSTHVNTFSHHISVEAFPEFQHIFLTFPCFLALFQALQATLDS